MKIDSRTTVKILKIIDSFQNVPQLIITEGWLRGSNFSEPTAFHNYSDQYIVKVTLQTIISSKEYCEFLKLKSELSRTNGKLIKGLRVTGVNLTRLKTKISKYKLELKLEVKQI